MALLIAAAGAAPPPLMCRGHDLCHMHGLLARLLLNGQLCQWQICGWDLELELRLVAMAMVSWTDCISSPWSFNLRPPGRIRQGGAGTGKTGGGGGEAGRGAELSGERVRVGPSSAL